MKKMSGKIISVIIASVMIASMFTGTVNVYADDTDLVEVSLDSEETNDNTEEGLTDLTSDNASDGSETALSDDISADLLSDGSDDLLEIQQAVDADDEEVTDPEDVNSDEADYSDMDTAGFENGKSNGYKIVYKLNGGKNNSQNPKTYTGKKKIVLKKPTKKGYTFKGWYKDKKFKKSIKGIKKGSKGKITVYAKWTVNKYTIKFNSNGGFGKMDPIKKCKYGKSIKLSGNKFSRSGYSFDGWNTKKDGKGKKYKNKANVKNLSAKNNATVTLYAQWKKSGTVVNDAISYSAYDTDYGVVVIVKNILSKPIDLTMTINYYKNGKFVEKRLATNYYFESGHTSAFQGYVYNVDYDSYKIEYDYSDVLRTMTSNLKNISVMPALTDNSLSVDVHNKGKKNDYTKVAVVFYKNGKIIGYDYQFAYVNDPGSKTTLNFSFPMSKNRERITPDNYKVYVNYSYSY